MALFSKILVANRGEIAIRIMRAAAELGIETVAVYSEDDAESLHLRKADHACPLTGAKGIAAYLDQAQLLAIAQQEGCSGIHPGYGFLSENADFAGRCQAAGIEFIGPSREALALFGDKVQARALAEQLGVPVMRGTNTATSLEEAVAFFRSLEPGRGMMIKAIAGGGGRGMREVVAAADIESAYQRCQSEALQAFGSGEVYVEERLNRSRHIEIQILGDKQGQTIHLGERECSIQRRHQKIVEMAPSPALSPELRAKLTADAIQLAQRAHYENLGTFEFLVDTEGGVAASKYAFIEANARLQVEHTVTEEVTGLDLVQLQLQIASGMSLSDLGLRQEDVPAPQGYAIQVRINMETMAPDGTVRPAGGTIAAFEPPSGRGGARRFVRLRGLSHLAQFRLLACQIDHPHAQCRLCRGCQQGVPSALRI